MDIALLSMAMSQVNTGQQVSLSVMKQAKETAEVQGEAVVKLLDSANQTAGHPHLGRNIDISY
ncbi:YjfB family protein [Alkalicoccobacillus plakortidis]|uniref:YjfB family protein n=1 Tax=Alkalicoccobacillus plakortidis TaxID=444060 RepID=A0ABT0XIR5_9BACI|nr:YjfB family protein [Alkalicoccobacillus plakortidis]MCM2675788.1 YjfB family protein [Alkalicoccobacillus plakortidis]